MITFLVILHILFAVLAIGTILLQDSKGGALAGFSGASQNVFGATEADNFLVRLTKWLSILFVVTSISLTYFINQKPESVLEGVTTESSKAPSQGQQATETKKPKQKKN